MQDSGKGADVYGTDMADSKGGDDMRRFILFLEYVFGEFGMETIAGIIGGITGALIVAAIARAL